MALEEEEEVKIKAGVYDLDKEPFTKEELEILRLGKKIKDKILIKKMLKLIKESNSNRAPMPRTSRSRQRHTTTTLRRDLSALGVDMSDTKNAHFTRTKSRSLSRPPLKKARVDSEGRVRSSSRPPRDQSGVRDSVVSTSKS